jgi:hypothetical protein
VVLIVSSSSSSSPPPPPQSFSDPSTFLASDVYWTAEVWELQKNIKYFIIYNFCCSPVCGAF